MHSGQVALTIRRNWLQNPYYFVCCSLINEDPTKPPRNKGDTGLSGTLVSSLHRLKDLDNTGKAMIEVKYLIKLIGIDGGFFVFGDLSVKVEGVFRLSFSLYELIP